MAVHHHSSVVIKDLAIDLNALSLTLIWQVQTGDEVQSRDQTLLGILIYYTKHVDT